MNTKRTPSIFGARVRQLRIKRGWTTRRLAAEASKHGVSLQHPGVTRLEKGDRAGNVHDRTAEAFAAALRTTVAYLRGYTDDSRRR